MCHENQGSPEELPFPKALPLEDVDRGGLVGNVLSSNRTRDRRNSRLTALWLKDDLEARQVLGKGTVEDEGPVLYNISYSPNAAYATGLGSGEHPLICREKSKNEDL